MANELKPCPFCGGKADLRIVSKGYESGEFSVTFEASCRECKIAFKSNSCFAIKNGYPEIVQDGYKDVMSRWNRRATDGE